MSVFVMGHVWQSELRDATLIAVLLCLANFADDDGSNSFPGTDRIAHMTRYSRRTVIRAIAELERQGWIEVVERGLGSGNLSEYRIDIDRLKRCQDVTFSPRRKKVSLTTRKGDTGARKGDTDDKPPHPHRRRTVSDPSGNHTPCKSPASGGHADALDLAAVQVCSALAIANPRKRKLLRGVIALEAEKGQPPPTIALAMIAAWQEQARRSRELRCKFGIEKFFSEGYWKDENRWHWDEELLRTRSGAAAGT